ncbi:hypothetical protein Nepgr_020907 [Nepenthes gracilis]|uniref:Uncharacterized protein n=1 Tax=Nepenthes gracilis TaxID=150966 RepID=A0AAD3XWU2_NEPGR|nr:hypothetical protein Nepgr_020907 [Nepenthes gracilis]
MNQKGDDLKNSVESRLQLSIPFAPPKASDEVVVRNELGSPKFSLNRCSTAVVLLRRSNSSGSSHCVIISSVDL